MKNIIKILSILVNKLLIQYYIPIVKRFFICINFTTDITYFYVLYTLELLLKISCLSNTYGFFHRCLTPILQCTLIC